MRFIYVMTKEDRDKLITMGFTLLKTDRRNKLWVFENKDVTTFASEDELTRAGVPFVFSDILTF